MFQTMNAGTRDCCECARQLVVQQWLELGPVASAAALVAAQGLLAAEQPEPLAAELELGLERQA